MPVVKAKHANIHQQSAIVMDLADIEGYAKRILSDAQAEAIRIIDNAKKNATVDATVIKETARKAGHDEGFAAGEAKGHQAGHDQAVKQVTANLEALTKRWNETLDIIEAHFPAHAADAKTDLVRLAVAIAARVTKQEALRNKKVAEANVADALSLVGAGRAVTLHVNPGELETIETYLPALVAKLRSMGAVEIKAAEAITAGGCEVHFGAGAIDATLETQIARIAAELVPPDDGRDEGSTKGKS